MKKQKILIIEDSEQIREILAEILQPQYDITQAKDGEHGIEILAQNETDFWLVLLDIKMQETAGLYFLSQINKRYWNDRVVVMIIYSDDSSETINRAYNLGAFDCISQPFEPMIVRKRIANTLFLYARQHDLETAVKEQLYEQQKNNELMISILSHIVESRNGESGRHLQRVKMITEMLLKRLSQLTDKYSLSEEYISLVSMASAFHDIGKISIPEEILNKPGKLTPEEFEIMKTHSEIGARMLSDLPAEQVDLPIVHVAHEICRWHHERYNGKGYPDGLIGEEIPVSAQVVALADVYDALTSERCYKTAFSHEKAMDMIFDGKCGAFNPILLQCLNEISSRLKKIYTSVELQGDMGQIAKIKYQGFSSNKQMGQPGYMQLLYVDSLTSVHNRRYYQEFMQDIYSIEAVALIDVDNLKQINTDYGHEIGDQVLRLTAQMLLSLIRRNDHLIRYGGDEFLIVFSNMTKCTFETRLEEIRQSFESLTIEKHPELRITVHIGGVYGTGKQKEIFRIVDNMMKQSKYTKKPVNICFLDEEEMDIR